MAENIKMAPKGTTFDLVTPKGTAQVTIPLVGLFNVYNVLTAAGIALAADIPFATITEGIEGLKGVRGRFELVDAGQDFPVIVDYAHTPDSLENVLNTCRGLTEGKLFVVVGCGGDRDKTKRPKMAKIAVDLADEPVFTADNPRSEDPLAILNDMEEGVKGLTITASSTVSRRSFCHCKRQKGDVVLIAGKGHETYQQIGGQTFDFDDAEVAKRAILELK